MLHSRGKVLYPQDIIYGPRNHEGGTFECRVVSSFKQYNYVAGLVYLLP